MLFSCKSGLLFHANQAFFCHADEACFFTQFKFAFSRKSSLAFHAYQNCFFMQLRLDFFHAHQACFYTRIKLAFHANQICLFTQIRLALSASDSVLTLGQPVLTLTPSHPAFGRPATKLPQLLFLLSHPSDRPWHGTRVSANL